MSGKILIVIPCLNEEAHLPGLLDQFLGDNPDATIVVADGGSSDRSRAIVAERQQAHPNLHLLENPARIQAVGVNGAVERFGDGHAWLVRVDAHCDYSGGYAKRLVATAEERGAASVVVPMVTQGVTCFQIAAATAQNSVIGTGGSAHRHVGRGRFVDHGHHALMAIDAFRRAGGYRDDMAANEDAELDCRLAKQRAPIWLEPSLAITYYPRRTPTALWRQYFRYGKGRARTLRIHRQRPKLRQLLPLASLAAVIAAFATPWWPLAALPFVGWLGATLGAGLYLGLKARRRCAAIVGVAAAIMHLAWATGFVSGCLRCSSVPK